MNYRHCYHAGNFADVIKHVALIVLLEAMQRKESPFGFLDTHAGIGLYSLQSEQAQKKQEYQNGIAKLFSGDPNQLTGALKKYNSIVRQYNPNGELKFYPGSPLIAKALLREQDQMILSELHPDDFQSLSDHFSKLKNIALHHTDAYLALKAFLPPKLKRALVLIDPPFEVTNEFQLISDALKRALKHWRSGNFMVWYPIKNRSAINAFYQDIQSLDAEKLALHVSLQNGVEPGKLSSCSILFINPPWKVKETLESDVLPVIASSLQLTWQWRSFSS